MIKTYNNLYQHNTFNINKFIAKLYIFCLTFRMISPLVDIANLFHGMAVYFDFILHVVGLFLLFLSYRGNFFFGDYHSSKLLRYFAFMVICFTVSSILMACIIQTIYGNYAGESAFSGILGQILYYFQYLLIIVYNINIFHLLSKEEIDRILSKLCWFLLFLGYYQILCYTFGGIFKTIGQTIDIFHILFPEEYMTKLSLTASEGAKAGGIVAIIVFPYLLSKITIYHQKISYYLQILLWLPVIAFMRSTSAYFMLIAVFFSFGAYLLKKTKNTLTIIFFFFTVIIALVTLFIVINPNAASDFSSIIADKNISYLVFNKINDISNGSTVLRKVPFIINWHVFVHFPVFGIGNGLQGYFYTEFFPYEMIVTSGVWEMYVLSTQTIVNGILFFPSVLSGYGIVGFLILCVYIKKMFSLLMIKKNKLGIFYPMFMFSIAAILVHGFQTDFSGKYYIWFILSIPYMFVNYDKNTRG